MHEELRYQLALTKIPQIGVVLARTLLEKFGSAREIFHAKRSQLEHTEGMGAVRTLQIKKFRDFDRVEKEMSFLETYRIRALCITDEAYPSRLRHCYDPPTLLFCKGVADLNAERMLAVVGTRTHTEYGKWITESLIRSLQEYHVTIISGMAFGIDACAHRSALQHQLPTIGALAHGLAYLYPPSHKKLAAEMIASSGALITEYWSDQAPDKHLFPARNRVVAGLCDALVVTESGIKGGSMLTAELASGYHKELFAFPGRSTDSKSEGCNLLIKANKAQLVCGPEDVAENMGWKQKSDLRPRVQRMIPFTLNDEEKKVMEEFATQSLHHIDQLSIATNLPMGVLSAILLELEMKGCIRSLPGKTYCSNL